MSTQQTEQAVTERVKGFADGYSTALIEEMDPNKDWEEWETWHGHGDWDINFHVRKGYMYADAYRYDSVQNVLITDKWERLFAKRIKPKKKGRA
jgi:hypothetical protein